MIKSIFLQKAFIIILPCLLFVLACQPPVEQDNTENVNVIIQSKWTTFIDFWQNEQADSCVSIYHDDIRLIGMNNAELVSSHDVAEFYQSLFDKHLPSMYEHRTHSLEVDNHLAIERADFTVQWVTLENEPWTFEARMMAHWSCDDDGQWKVKSILFTGVPEKSEITPGDEL